MRQSTAARDRLFADVKPAIDYFNCVTRHAVGFESGLTSAGLTMKFPLMPGTHDIVAVEAPLTERPADMIADVRDGAELAADTGERDPSLPDATGASELRLSSVGRAHLDPVRLVFCSFNLPAMGSDVTHYDTSPGPSGSSGETRCSQDY